MVTWQWERGPSAWTYGRIGVSVRWHVGTTSCSFDYSAWPGVGLNCDGVRTARQPWALAYDAESWEVVARA